MSWRWPLLLIGLLVIDVALVLLWLGGTTLDEDCDDVRVEPESTGSDWACTDLIQTVGPYAVYPLVVMLVLTALSAVGDARRVHKDRET